MGMDMTPDRQAAALLERAYELMNDEGRHWIKGNYTRPVMMEGGSVEDAYCSVGALDKARVLLYGDDEWSAYYRALGILAQSARGYEGGSATVISWNDDEKTTWTEVSTAFKSAIKKLRGK